MGNVDLSAQKNECVNVNDLYYTILHILYTLTHITLFYL